MNHELLIGGLFAAICVLVMLVFYLVTEVHYINAELDDEETVDHAMCIAHISDAVSKRVVAMAFRDAARRWESVEEKANLQRLAHDKFHFAGRSIPALWMEQQGDLLDPDNREESA